MTHIMVDIETLGSRPGSAILSIGAVKFGPRGNVVAEDGEETFYRNVDPATCTSAGLRIQGDTVAWWFEQDDAAIKKLKNPSPVPISDALKSLAQWLKQMSCKYVWAHGAPFDPVLLDSCFFACRLPVPWKFWDLRDTRTIFHLANTKVTPADRQGLTHHNALDDAIAQARAVQRSYATLGLLEEKT